MKRTYTMDYTRQKTKYGEKIYRRHKVKRQGKQIEVRGHGDFTLIIEDVCDGRSIMYMYYYACVYYTTIREIYLIREMSRADIAKFLTAFLEWRKIDKSLIGMQHFFKKYEKKPRLAEI